MKFLGHGGGVVGDLVNQIEGIGEGKMYLAVVVGAS